MGKTIKKTRLMCIHRLCSASSAEIAPYAKVEKALEVSADDVETWMVHAINIKLLDAKIDQSKKVIIVHSCTHRTFMLANWQKLLIQLKKISTMIDEFGKMLT